MPRQIFDPTPKICPNCGQSFTPTGPDRSRQKTCSRACAQALNAAKGKGVSGQRGKHRLRTGQIPGKDGYIRVLVGDHPFPRKYHYMFEHVKVMETAIGRQILPTEVVHHKDGNRKNNRLDNLELMERKDHVELHAARIRKTD